MTKIDIISGFLGAGKTTLIKKLIEEALKGEQVVLIENEFGEIGIDSGFLKDSGIQINEMNSGCICCSLVGDFKTALGEVLDQFRPDRIIIEPSGVGKLSDVMNAVQNVVTEDVVLNSHIAVADAKRAKMYLKNFGEFYKNQIEYASAIILSRTQELSEDKLHKTIDLIRGLNDKSSIVTTPWEELTGQQLLEVIEGKNDFAAELLKAAQEASEAHAREHEHEHHHHDHDHEEHEHHHDHDHEEHEHHHDHDHEEHEHHHHHDHDHEEHEHEHDHEEHEHHHDHDHEEHEHHHHDHDHEEHEHHHHDHDHHGHHHHGHHHAEDIFSEWGKESPKKFAKEEIEGILARLAREDSDEFGTVLRAKGIIPSVDGKWFHFDLVPGDTEVRYGSPDYTGRICVIGAGLKEDKLKELFGI